MEDNEEQGMAPRKILLWGSAGVLLVALCVGGGMALWPRYKTWSSVRALKEAQEAHMAGEYRRQQLFLEQAVQMDSSNLEARRQLALFAFQAGLPQAVDLWSALTEVEPGLMENHRGLILALLRRGDIAQAVASLARVPVGLHRDLEYRRVAAAVAMSSGNVADLELQLSAMAQFENAPEGLKLSRAALALGSADLAVKVAAQEQLEVLAREDPYRIRATLCLLRALPPAQPGMAAPAEALAERILGSKSKASSILPRVRPGLSDLLQHMMAQPSPSPEDVAALMQWMRLQGLAREALFWVSSQTLEQRNAPRVLMERANSAMQTAQWNELREAVAKGVWGAVPDEAVTLVFAARIQRDAGSVANSRATWADAQTLAENDPVAMRALYRLAQGWGWKNEAERCLQVLVKFYPREDPLWSALLYQAQMEGSADKALQVLENWSRAQGAPMRVVAEQMLLASLLDRLSGPQQEKLVKIASEEGAVPLVRLAAALQRCRRAAADEAVVLPEGLELPALSPRARLAWGILLLQAGKFEQAKAAIAGLGQVAFLPEEKVLLSKVQELRPVFKK